MSVEKSSEEARRWYETAIDDLETARILQGNAKYAQCCFHCQQAAEKAMKAVYYAASADPWGHSVLRLVQGLAKKGLPGETFPALGEKAKRLDQYYVPTRCPNGLPGTIPSQAYGPEDAQAALDAAGAVLDAVGTHLKYEKE